MFSFKNANHENYFVINYNKAFMGETILKKITTQNLQHKLTSENISKKYTNFITRNHVFSQGSP
jgi:GTP-sensing pleiotropic transcriptional regulator CodY